MSSSATISGFSAIAWWPGPLVDDSQADPWAARPAFCAALGFAYYCSLSTIAETIRAAPERAFSITRSKLSRRILYPGNSRHASSPSTIHWHTTRTKLLFENEYNHQRKRSPSRRDPSWWRRQPALALRSSVEGWIAAVDRARSAADFCAQHLRAILFVISFLLRFGGEGGVSRRSSRPSETPKKNYT